MKRYVLSTLFFCLSSLCAHHHMSPPALDDMHEMTDHEVHAVTSITSQQTFSLQRWCITKISMLMGYYAQYKQHLLKMLGYTHKKKRRRKRNV